MNNIKEIIVMFGYYTLLGVMFITAGYLLLKGVSGAILYLFVVSLFALFTSVSTGGDKTKKETYISKEEKDE